MHYFAEPPLCLLDAYLFFKIVCLWDLRKPSNFFYLTAYEWDVNPEIFTFGEKSEKGLSKYVKIGFLIDWSFIKVTNHPF